MKFARLDPKSKEAKALIAAAKRHMRKWPHPRPENQTKERRLYPAIELMGGDGPALTAAYVATYCTLNHLTTTGE